MTEIQAAIGVVQLRRLPEFLAKRTNNAQTLNKLLGKTEKVKLPSQLDNRTSSWYLYTVRIKNGTQTQRNTIITELHNKGIGAEAYYPTPIHQMPYYRETFGQLNLPETEKAANQVLSLPIHPSVTEEQIQYIAETLIQLL